MDNKKGTCWRYKAGGKIKVWMNRKGNIEEELSSLAVRWSMLVPEHQQQLLFRWRRWERADKPQVDCSLVGSFSVGVCVGVCLLYIWARVCALLHHSLQALHSHTQKELSQRQLVPCSVPSSHRRALVWWVTHSDSQTSSKLMLSS